MLGAFRTISNTPLFRVRNQEEASVRIYENFKCHKLVLVLREVNGDFDLVAAHLKIRLQDLLAKLKQYHFENWPDLWSGLDQFCFRIPMVVRDLMISWSATSGRISVLPRVVGRTMCKRPRKTFLSRRMASMINVLGRSLTDGRGPR